MSISVQQKDFSVAEEYQKLCTDAPHIGAIVTFCGLVREFDHGEGKSLDLEHFPGMTEKVLENIIDQAKQRWNIINARIVHRIGLLNVSEQIVFVGVNSPHRQDAFKACEFIMDFLKTEAPFWKKAIAQHKHYWVDAKESDNEAKEKWNKSND